ncbi:serine protease [Acinetobacter lactucae]|uniref:ABC-three component system protein n=1 Tax=Acinetobacter lactucae TaxID=1785128 RepID=UPI0021CD9AE8|nr:ABC-three component system protein [Acinetobacter lactucae]MCU4347516.1 serine protease [Acinetobacter lactucae]
MTVFEIMQSYCVRVNGGSGVLVNAMTQNYSYVLTAAHVLDDITVHEVFDYQGNPVEILEILRHSDPFVLATLSNDYVILKVSFQAHVAQKIFNAKELKHSAGLTLVGYPQGERTSQTPIKFYDGHITNVNDDLISFTINGMPSKSEIEGMSGGGMYFQKDGQVFLTGVEFRMDASDEKHQYSRVQCHSLQKFYEIIEINRSAPMIPAHLECFSRMRERIFAFNVIDQNNIYHLKAALEGFADSLIASGMPPPYEVMAQYKLQLLVDSKRPDELETRELWTAYLEFLVICALMDNVGVTNVDYIKSIERKRRLLYTSNDKNWISHLEELLKTARRLLDKDGTLIVASPQSAADLTPSDIRLTKVINDIAVVPNQGPFDSIDNVESSIYQSFKLTHLEALRKRCVIDYEDEYMVKQPGREQLQLFRDKLDVFIK